MCLFNKLGRSNDLPQISHGSIFLSPRGARCFGGATIVASIKSPELLLPEDIYESPEIDLRSSSVFGDEIGGIMSATSDIDKSSGESMNGKREVEFFIFFFYFFFVISQNATS